MTDQQQEQDWAERMGQMREELRAWREAHSKATWDEMVAQVTPWRRELMGQLVAELAQEGQGGEAPEEAVICPTCGAVAEFRGWQQRQVIHFEGDSTLERCYYYCPRCERGFFPPRPTTRP